MPLHDFMCNLCGWIVVDMDIRNEHMGCVCGQGQLEIYYHARTRSAIAIGPQDATVVYEHPVTKHVVYPGRNDQPMPERYRVSGYQRKEMRTLREIDRFSETHGLVNERANYNSGNGYDGDHR